MFLVISFQSNYFSGYLYTTLLTVALRETTRRANERSANSNERSIELAAGYRFTDEHSQRKTVRTYV
jgi:hypothetical protein